MDKEKDRLEQAYTDRETETAQFILIDTNLPINLGEDGDRRLFGGRLKESLEKMTGKSAFAGPACWN